MRYRILALLFLSLISLRCGGSSSSSSTGGSETGNATTISLRVISYQTSELGGLTLPRIAVSNLDITTARVVLDRIRFRPFSECADEDDGNGEDEIRFDGPFVVDLLETESVLGLEDLEVPTGRYCRIEIVLKTLESDNLPSGVGPSDPIIDRSVLIEGTRTDGTAFRIATEVDEEFKLENESGFILEASSVTQILFIAFNLDEWFAGVDLSDPSVVVSVLSSGERMILIDEDNNEEIQEVIEDNIENSADLFEDEDEDEKLDPEEEEDSLAAGMPVP